MAIADNSLNTTHISTNLRSYEAARSGFFVFMIPNPKETFANLIRPGVDPDSTELSVSNGGLFNAETAADAIRLNVTKASVPNFKVNTLDYRRGNDVVHFAGTPEFSDGTITVDDVVGMETKNILYAWLELAYNPITRKGGRMADYKKNCKLIEYTQDMKMIRTWSLEGCFVTNIDEDGFDKESDGKRQLNVTISYDRAIMEPEDPENI